MPHIWNSITNSLPSNREWVKDIARIGNNIHFITNKKKV